MDNNISKIREEVIGNAGTNKILDNTKKLDSIRHVDENGVEYWLSHELSKICGYKDYRNFELAIERAKQQLISLNKNYSEYIVEVNEILSIGQDLKGKREVPGYKLSRKGAYLVVMNGDPRKLEIALAQEYFLQNTRNMELLIQRFQFYKDMIYRIQVKAAVKAFNFESIQNGVRNNELGILHSKGDEGFYGMSTKELKTELNIPNNRPVADFVGPMNLYKEVAYDLTTQNIKNEKLYGLDQISDALYDNSLTMRKLVIDNYKSTPELIAQNYEDIKIREKKMKQLSQKDLDIIEQEF